MVREEDCVGCAKCIAACPVDAIVGASGFTHTVLTDVCIGCKLCIAPCPMDCIELVDSPEPNDAEKRLLAEKTKQRYQARLKRLAQRHAQRINFYNEADKAGMRAHLAQIAARIKNKNDASKNTQDI